MERTCINCGLIFEGRKDAKYCSSKCRVEASRKSIVGEHPDKIVVLEPEEKKAKKDFNFYTLDSRSKSGYHENDDGTPIIRWTRYWYDVPFGAIPVAIEGQPDMPEWMNGRQYFLWRENDFKMDGDNPVIVNPIPTYKDFKYDMGGENARKWGA